MNPLRNLWYTITGQTQELPPKTGIRLIRNEAERTGLPLAEIERLQTKYHGSFYNFLTSKPGSKEERSAASLIAQMTMDTQHRDAHNITTLAQWLISTRTPREEDTWRATRDRATDDIDLIRNLSYHPELKLTTEQKNVVGEMIDHIRAKNGLGNF